MLDRQTNAVKAGSTFVFAGAISTVTIRRISNIPGSWERRDAESAIVRNVVFRIIDRVRNTEAIGGIGRPGRKQLRMVEAAITRPNTLWNSICRAAGILMVVSAG